MELNEKQKAEQAEVLLCHKHMAVMIRGALDDGVSLSILLVSLEMEAHRLKTLILVESYARFNEKDAGGMYQ